MYLLQCSPTVLLDVAACKVLLLNNAHHSLCSATGAILARLGALIAGATSLASVTTVIDPGAGVTCVTCATCATCACSAEITNSQFSYG